MDPRNTYAGAADPGRLRIAPRRRGPYRYTRLRWRALFAVIDAVGWCLWVPVRLVRRLRRRPWPMPRRVLVVQLDHFGDAVMSLGMLAALRRRFPAAELDVVCSPWNRELFAAVAHVDGVRVMASRFARRGGLGWLWPLFAAAWKLRKRHYDLAIDVRGEFPHALLMWLAGARRRLGWNCGGGGFLLTDSAAYVAGRHEVLSRGALLAQLGIDVAAGALAPRWEPAAEDLRWARRWIAQGSGARPVVALHVGSRMQAKRWPDASWHELACRLIVAHGACVVLLGGADDRREGDRLAALHGAVDLRGATTIPRLAAVLRLCSVVVSADSGPAHLAAAVGTPVAALFSGTNDAGQWRPWGEAVTVVRRPPACSPCHREDCPWADHPCMRGIGPEEVARHVDALLAARATETQTALDQPLQHEAAVRARR